MQPGDTPSTVAQRYILPEHDWRDVMRLARGHDPHRLPRGATLSIPRAWLRWKPERARLVSTRGTVTVSIGGRRVTPAVGTVLDEGAEIATAASSFVTLALSNGSRIALPSQSRVRVARLRKYLINGALDYRFALEQGRVETKVAPLKDAADSYIINTPLAMTAVRGTEYAVALEPQRDTTGTGVFEGTVAVSSLDGTGPQAIPKGFGAVTDATGQSARVELLPAPALSEPGRVQTADLVTFDLTPVPGAAAYHVQLASDAGFVDSYFEQDSATPHFAIPSVPNGNQFVRVSAIDRNRLGGLRETYSFLRRLASVGAEVSETPDGFAFKWFGNGEGVRHYRLQIFRGEAKGVPVVDEVGLTGTEVSVRDLSPGVYYWRVGMTQHDAEGDIENWTDPEKLTIAAPVGG